MVSFTKIKAIGKFVLGGQNFQKQMRKIGFENPERDIDLGGLLRWLQVSVMPNIKNLERIGYRFGFDIYKMMKEFPIDEFSKKQERLYNNLNTKKGFR